MDRSIQRTSGNNEGKEVHNIIDRQCNTVLCEGSKGNTIICVPRETDGGIGATAESRNHCASYRSYRVVCSYYCGNTEERVRSNSHVRGPVQAESLHPKGGYQSPTPAEAMADMAAEEAKFFTVIDAMKGYHQRPLDEESQGLTTFITPFGHYKYLRALYGLSSIAEHYNRCTAEAFEGLKGLRRVVDDIVIYDKDETDHVDHVRQFLQCCCDKGISLNREK